MGVFQHIFEEPTPNQVWNKDRTDVIKSKHTEELWIELFGDLVFVQFFLSLGDIYDSCGVGFISTCRIGLIFHVLFYFRLRVDEYCNRFSSEDVLSRVLYGLYIYGIALMVINLEGNIDCKQEGAYTLGFLGGYIFTRGAIIALLLPGLITSELCRRQYLYVEVLNVVFFIISCFGYFTTRDRRFHFYAGILFSELCFLVPLRRYVEPLMMKLINMPQVGGINVTIPVNILVSQRRMCIFVMMVAGEGVIQLLSPKLDNSTPETTRRCYLYATAGMISIFSCSMLYNDSVVRDKVEDHAMRRSVLSAIPFAFLHPLLAFAFFMICLSIKLAYHDVGAAVRVDSIYNTLMGFSFFFFTLSCVYMRCLHKGLSNITFWREDDMQLRKKGMLRFLNYFYRILFAFAHLALGIFSWYGTHYHQDDDAGAAHRLLAGDDHAAVDDHAAADDHAAVGDDHLDGSHRLYAGDRHLYYHTIVSVICMLIEILASHVAKQDECLTNHILGLECSSPLESGESASANGKISHDAHAHGHHGKHAHAHGSHRPSRSSDSPMAQGEKSEIDMALISVSSRQSSALNNDAEDA